MHLESEEALRQADLVLAVLPGPFLEWVAGLNPRVESLSGFYGAQIDRVDTYARPTTLVARPQRDGPEGCQSSQLWVSTRSQFW